MSIDLKQGSPLAVLFGAACIMVIIVGFRFSAAVVAPILFAFNVAVVITPALAWMRERGLPQGLAVVILVVVTFVAGAVIVFVLYVELNRFGQKLPEYRVLWQQRMSNFDNFLSDHGVDRDEAFKATGVSSGAALESAAKDIVRQLISMGTALCFFGTLLLMMLAESAGYGKRLRAHAADGSRIMMGMRSYALQLQENYKIRTVGNLISAAALTAEYLLFGIDFAILWGLLAFILGYIPQIGLILATIPVILLAFVLHGPLVALVVLIIGILLNAAMDNLVTPRFTSNALNIPVTVSFISVIVFGWVFGVIGPLLAIPIIVAIREYIKDISQAQLAVAMIDNGSTDLAGGSKKDS